MAENISEYFDTAKVIEEFEAMTKNVEQVQRGILRKILQDNAEAEYLKELGINGETNIETFKERVPLVAHKDLEHYIQRIIDGDNSPILTAKPITNVSWSSGTTEGRQKFFPFNNELFDNTAQIFRTSFAFRNKEFPLGNGKTLNFIYGSTLLKTKGGLLSGTATTNVFRHPLYVPTMKSIQSENCSPLEVIFGSDFQQSLYCHLLCGLLHHDEIQFLSSTFVQSIIHALEKFETFWEDLCLDIRVGVLNERITDINLRAIMANIIRKPNPELAEKIHNICCGLNNWYGLIPKLFPNVKYVYAIMTGSMLPYITQLRRYSGELPLISADYGASEGWVGVNINPSATPENATFAIPPNIAYYEFIPLGEEGPERKTIGLHEVELGEEYEIVFTTSGGLYRYRVGDVVKVVGFYNTTPEIKFVRRLNLVLNISIDKNTEENVYLAVEESMKLLEPEKVNLVDFTSHLDFSKGSGHYVICWELSRAASEKVLQECCNLLDREFCSDAGYDISRKVGTIGPLELRILGKGTFQKMALHSVSMGTAASQYKVPRCVGDSNKVVLEIVTTNVVNTYASTLFD